MNILLERVSRLFDGLDRRWDSRTTQHRIGTILVGAFLVALLAIEFNRQGWLPEGLGLLVPLNHFHAVNLAFTLLLLFEVIALVFNLAESVSYSLGKQFEILSLSHIQKPQGIPRAPVVQGHLPLITDASGSVELVLTNAGSHDAPRRPGAHAPGVVEITCSPTVPQGETGRRLVKVEEKGGAPKAGEPEAKSEVRVRKTVTEHDQKSVVVSIDLKDAELADSMKMAARLLDAKLLMDTSLGGRKVTIKMDEVPVQAFLGAGCKQAGATWQLKPGAPPTLEVGKGL